MLDRYLAQVKVSPNTKLAIRRDVGAFLAKYDPLKATAEDVQCFLEHDAERGLSRQALHERYRNLQGFFSFLLAGRLIHKNPMRNVREPETQGNLKKILGLRDQAITALLEEGLTSTILALLETGCLHRGNKLHIAGEETVRLRPKTAKALQQYIAVRHHLHPKNDILFIGQHGKSLTDKSIRRVRDQFARILRIRNQAIAALRAEGLADDIIAQLTVERAHAILIAAKRTPLLATETIKSLERYMRIRRWLYPNENVLFLNQRGRPLKESGIRRARRPG